MNRPFAQITIGAITMAVLMAACSSEQEVRISALHHFERGNHAYEQEDYRGAVRQYLAAIELDEEISEVHYNLGLSYYRIGEWELAAQSLDQARRITPKRPEIHYNLALVYNKQYDIELAHRHFNTYRELAAHDPTRLAKKAAQARAQPPPPLPMPVPAAKPSPVRVGRPGVAPTAQARPQRSTNPAAAEPARRVDSFENEPNPFQGSDKWWTEDLPIQ